MRTYKEVADLLALAREIEQTEGVTKAEAMDRALAILPRLVNDAQQNRRYRPRLTRAIGQIMFSRVRAG